MSGALLLLVFAAVTATLFFAWLSSWNTRSPIAAMSPPADCTSLGRGGLSCAGPSATGGRSTGEKGCCRAASSTNNFTVPGRPASGLVKSEMRKVSGETNEMPVAPLRGEYPRAAVTPRQAFEHPHRVSSDGA